MGFFPNVPKSQSHTNEEESSKILGIIGEELVMLKERGDLKSNILADGSEEVEAQSIQAYVLVLAK